MTYEGPHGLASVASGAPEAVLQLITDGKTADLEEWDRLVHEQATAGSRLLLLASRADHDHWMPEALLAFRDPLRPEIPGAMAVADAAGIQTILVTGDHPSTAAAIARETAMPTGRMITNAELAS